MNPDFLTMEAELTIAGLKPLTGLEISQAISGKTMLGEFGAPFKFIMSAGDDGTLEGKNNAGAHHFGVWSVDPDNHTLTVKWNAGWENTTNRAYQVGPCIKLFEVNSGQWRTTLTDFQDGCQQPLLMPA